MSNSEPAQIAESVSPVVARAVLPEGYQWNIHSNSPVPYFDREGRRVTLLLHVDGTVTWQLQGKNGEVLDPELIDG